MVSYHFVHLTCYLLFTYLAAAAVIPKANVIKVDLTLHNGDTNARLVRRDGATASVFNQRTQYLATIEIGSPAQSFNVVLDTGRYTMYI